MAPRALSAENFSGVADHCLNLCLRQPRRVGGHLCTTVADHCGLVLGIRKGLGHGAGEASTAAPTPRNPVAAATAFPVDLTSDDQHRIGLTTGAERHLW